MTTLTTLFRRGPGIPPAKSASHHSRKTAPTAPPVADHASGAGAVRFESVGKTYHAGSGAVPALHGIDLDIPAGGIFGIIGRSGAGKSTLLRTINRLESPTQGRVLVDGADIATLDDDGLVALRRRVGMIFQHFNLLSAKTVWENVALPLKVAGVPRDEIARRVEALLALVGLEGKHHVYPGRLSGGQKQRVGIARALVHRPQILLCDEATSALDPETTQSILQLLRDIHREMGLTIVLITHEMRVIREICDRVLVLEGGAMAESGPVWQVFGDPRHDATRALLEPLARGLPEDLREGLLATPPALGRYRRITELHYTGAEGDAPDLSKLAALGEGVRLLHGGLDRIQGHTQGRLLLSLPGDGHRAEALAAPGLAHHVKVLGYVPDPD